MQYTPLWRRRGPDLDVHPRDVEHSGLQVVGLGLQSGRALLAGEEVAGGTVCRLQLLLLGRGLLVQTAQAAVAAPAEHRGRLSGVAGV